MENQEIIETRETREPRETRETKLHRRKKWLTILALCIFLMGVMTGILGSFVGIYYAKNAILVDKTYVDTVTRISEKYAKMEFLYSMIHKYYYGEYTDQELMEGAYAGLFSALDEYSQYLSEEDYQKLMNYTNASFQGVGVIMSATDDNKIQIVSFLENSPAKAAGLKEGDYILAVNGTEFDGEHMSDCSAALKQDVGTKLKITYERKGKKDTVTVTCNTVATGTVFSQVLEDSKTGKSIGYIRITSFGENTYKDFDNDLRDMEVDGVDGVIIDIRNNGGGMVEEATKIADRLLPEGTIMITKTKTEEDVYVNSDASCTKIPYVVLVNENSASASEILAAAIQGNKAAPIIGTVTFGKGVLQNIGHIGTGKDAFKITYAEYFGPNDLKINKKGINPDYEVKNDLDTPEDEQLEKALDEIEKLIKN